MGGFSFKRRPLGSPLPLAERPRHGAPAPLQQRRPKDPVDEVNAVTTAAVTSDLYGPAMVIFIGATPPGPANNPTPDTPYYVAPKLENCFMPSDGAGLVPMCPGRLGPVKFNPMSYLTGGWISVHPLQVSFPLGSLREVGIDPMLAGWFNSMRWLGGSLTLFVTDKLGFRLTLLATQQHVATQEILGNFQEKISAQSSFGNTNQISGTWMRWINACICYNDTTTEIYAKRQASAFLEQPKDPLKTQVSRFLEKPPWPHNLYKIDDQENVRSLDDFLKVGQKCYWKRPQDLTRVVSIGIQPWQSGKVLKQNWTAEFSCKRIGPNAVISVAITTSMLNQNSSALPLTPVYTSGSGSGNGLKMKWALPCANVRDEDRVLAFLREFFPFVHSKTLRSDQVINLHSIEAQISACAANANDQDEELRLTELLTKKYHNEIPHSRLWGLSGNSIHPWLFKVMLKNAPKGFAKGFLRGSNLSEVVQEEKWPVDQQAHTKYTLGLVHEGHTEAGFRGTTTTKGIVAYSQDPIDDTRFAHCAITYAQKRSTAHRQNNLLEASQRLLGVQKNAYGHPWCITWAHGHGDLSLTYALKLDVEQLLNKDVQLKPRPSSSTAAGAQASNLKQWLEERSIDTSLIKLMEPMAQAIEAYKHPLPSTAASASHASALKTLTLWLKRRGAQVRNTWQALAASVSGWLTRLKNWVLRLAPAVEPAVVLPETFDQELRGLNDCLKPWITQHGSRAVAALYHLSAYNSDGPRSEPQFSFKSDNVAHLLEEATTNGASLSQDLDGSVGDIETYAKLHEKIQNVFEAIDVAKSWQDAYLDFQPVERQRNIEALNTLQGDLSAGYDRLYDRHIAYLREHPQLSRRQRLQAYWAAWWRAPWSWHPHHA